MLRQYLIPIVRWETPVLANFQTRWRSPAMDSYFAFTANLGTHTFFMVILPILFWCGHIRLGRAMVHMLSSGVFFSGWLKDFFCLPRPLSPPLQRISRSASAALEYGFPSTHSTNAVSVAIFAIYEISQTPEINGRLLSYALFSAASFYAVSIVVGRLYCGMHGYFDVVIGSLLGALIAGAQILLGDAFDRWILFGPAWNIMLAILIILVLVRTHPEPADDCPCFDDSVAFAGVFIGVQVGEWHSGFLPWARSLDLPGPPFDLDRLGILKAAMRIILGVLVIFAWRGASKSALLKGLPSVLRLVESAGLDQPRRFFLRASQYKHVPPLRKDDNVIPAMSDIPGMIGSLRHPRKRAISIGPQSQADAYEAIAFRERKRRESQSSTDGTSRPLINGRPEMPLRSSTTSIVPSARNTLPEPALISVSEQGASTVQDIGSVAEQSLSGASKETNATADQYAASDAKEDRAMFLQLQKPRVRYDVEVVTKLIVYSGESHGLFFAPDPALMSGARDRVVVVGGHPHPLRTAGPQPRHRAVRRPGHADRVEYIVSAGSALILAPSASLLPSVLATLLFEQGSLMLALHHARWILQRTRKFLFDFVPHRSCCLALPGPSIHAATGASTTRRNAVICLLLAVSLLHDIRNSCYSHGRGNGPAVPPDEEVDVLTLGEGAVDC